ncbi:MAG: magnesium/cobalt transporter CorA [Bacteroidetes bacterium]|nr:magnesium/cobalt transporter CorA [Bacteroidota bacterium]
MTLVSTSDKKFVQADGSTLELIRYNSGEVNEFRDLPVEKLLEEIKPGSVNWINVDGLHEQKVFDQIGQKFNLHNLLLEDLTTENQPKAEEYDSYLFFTLKMLHHITQEKVDYEQVSFVLGQDFLLSFQEKGGDFFGSFREKIRSDQGRVRKLKTDYLLYRLLDIVIDQYYVVLDDLGGKIENIEEEILEKPSAEGFRRIQHTKKELIFLRKALYPLRDAISKLTKGESDYVSQENVRYFSDLHDHVAQLISTMDTYRDLTTSLMDIHINAMNTRMNEVMKVLAVISTIFMPLTFIVGIYGMNFEFMPELHWPFGYLYVMILMGLIMGSMIFYFRYKKWF